MVKIMYHNPLGNSDYDQVFLDATKAHARPGTEIHVTSLPPEDGAFEHIEYRSYEGRVTTGVMRAVRAAARADFDAFVIGCFYDTALHEARELSGDMIVVAPCMAACEIATSLANRFGVIIGRRKWANQMHGNIVEYGHGGRCTGLYHVELGVTEFQADHDETEKRLLAAGRRAVEEDYAEAIILGCTLEIGFHERLQDQLGVPVIDPSIAAFKRAEYAAALRRDCGWVPSRKWTCEAPPEEEMARVGGFDVNRPFGNHISGAA